MEFWDIEKRHKKDPIDVFDYLHRKEELQFIYDFAHSISGNDLKVPGIQQKVRYNSNFFMDPRSEYEDRHTKMQEEYKKYIKEELFKKQIHEQYGKRVGKYRNWDDVIEQPQQKDISPRAKTWQILPPRSDIGNNVYWKKPKFPQISTVLKPIEASKTTWNLKKRIKQSKKRNALPIFNKNDPWQVRLENKLDDIRQDQLDSRNWLLKQQQKPLRSHKKLFDEGFQKQLIDTYNNAAFRKGINKQKVNIFQSFNDNRLYENIDYSIQAKLQSQIQGIITSERIQSKALQNNQPKWQQKCYSPPLPQLQDTLQKLDQRKLKRRVAQEVLNSGKFSEQFYGKEILTVDKNLDDQCTQQFEYSPTSKPEIKLEQFN